MTQAGDGRDGPVLRALQEHRETVEGLVPLADRIAEAAERLADRLREGGTIFWMGNGGSAADSQHLAAELVGRYGRIRGALPSLALTTDSSVLTSVANDSGFEQVFARQLEALCGPGDAVVAISTSGRSPNVLAGVRTARRLGALTVGLSGGAGGELARLADLCVAVPSSSVARIQEAHILIGHIWCERLERLAAVGEPGDGAGAAAREPGAGEPGAGR